MKRNNYQDLLLFAKNFNGTSQGEAATVAANKILEQEWEKIQQLSDSPAAQYDALKQYTQLYPNTKYSQQAEIGIAARSTGAEKVWKTLRKKAEIDSIQEFALAFPKLKVADEARSFVLDKLLKRNNYQDLLLFAKNFNGTSQGEAATVAANKILEQEWEKIQQLSDSPAAQYDALKQYTQLYPNTKYSQQAEIGIKANREINLERDPRSVEVEKIWKTLRKKAEIDSIQEFALTFQKLKIADEARSFVLDKLLKRNNYQDLLLFAKNFNGTSQGEAATFAANKLLEQEWEKIQQLNYSPAPQYDALKQYIQLYPNTKYSQQAKSRLIVIAGRVQLDRQEMALIKKESYNGQYLIKISRNGKSLSKDSAKWTCVFDQKNALYWEVKSEDGAIEGYKFNTWQAYVRDVNKRRLCGFNNWEMPTIEELSTLIRCRKGNYRHKTSVKAGCRGPFLKPTIDRFFFPNARDNKHWSLSPMKGIKPFSYGLAVDFTHGTKTKNSIYDSEPIRLVRKKNSKPLIVFK